VTSDQTEPLTSTIGELKDLEVLNTIVVVLPPA